ncbi:MAG TPA: OmpA family protein [Burkholderiaceae bacterium]|nr:OmpA family protein [Burkholderiaceae bacterium]
MPLLRPYDMNPTCLPPLRLMMLACLLSGAAVQAQNLTPADQRISDREIHADYQTFEQAQARIRALNDKGRPLRDYHLAKAQCWLDTAFHEYSRNDRSAYPQEALNESLSLVQQMERGTNPLPMDTRLVNDADRLRPDLWAAADRLRSHAGLQCVADQLACAEVELVHAGNELRQQGWRHAKPYVQLAEDALARAGATAETCLPKPAAPVVAAVVPAPPPVLQAPKPLPQPFEFQANVLFNHDRYRADQARAMTLERLDAAVRRAGEAGSTLVQIQLIGHADRTGNTDYNEALARARVQTVSRWLQDKGIAPSLIGTAVRGEREPVGACEGRFRSRAEELECLLPNRRVEVNFITTRIP